MSYHFWKELFNQNPVKKRLESSYGSLGKTKIHFDKHWVKKLSLMQSFHELVSDKMSEGQRKLNDNLENRYQRKMHNLVNKII